MHECIRLHPADNVATALRELEQGSTIQVLGSNGFEQLTIHETIPFGHKVALRSIPRGNLIIKYGHVIGRATLDIESGSLVHSHNVEGLRGRGDSPDLVEAWTQVPYSGSELIYQGVASIVGSGRAFGGSATGLSNLVLKGFRRADGRVGFRNHVLVLAAMDNVNGIVERISAQVRGTIPVTIWYGRGQFGKDAELTFRTLVGLGQNPNTAAVLVVSLEPVSARRLADAIGAAGKRVAQVSVQECGGTPETIYRGATVALDMVLEASRLEPERVSVSDLVMGVECGGSDATSGLVTNPVLGMIADEVVDNGGTVIVSETSELIGTEHLLAKRARSPEIAKRIYEIVWRVEEDARARGVSILGANPVPDNIAGGLTTIEEKALGAMVKGGSRPIEGVLDYAEAPPGKGLYIMDTPAPASESITGLAAAGAQVILFSTGKGNIVGSTLAPTIKICANPSTLRAMKADIDVDVSDLVAGEQSFEQAAGAVKECLAAVSRGMLTRAEILGNLQVVLSRIERTV
ncbi:MAG: altronate dehydratase family protein [Bacillota bacterium]